MTPGNSSIVFWGERGLISSLFIDLAGSKVGVNWNEFFALFNLSDWEQHGHELRVSVVVEPDFSNLGFGHPDAILRVEFSSGATIVAILEAKRLPYSKSCSLPSSRGGSGYNSTLNGQLELNHCLALALSELTVDGTKLQEPGWILHTPYLTDRRGRLRSLTNPAVIEAIGRPFSGLPFRSYYHLIITADSSNPLHDADNQAVWPELYHPEFPFKNCWEELNGQFGWASWDMIERIMAIPPKAHAEETSIFLPTLNANRNNFRQGLGSAFESEGGLAGEELTIANDPPTSDETACAMQGSQSTANRGMRFRGRGVAMIYAPKINPNSFVHFSWLNEKCAIRDYSKGSNIMPFEDRRRATDVERLIEKRVQIRRRQPISNVAYWHKTTIDLNASELGGLPNAP